METFRWFGPVHIGTGPTRGYYGKARFLRYPGIIALNSGTTFFETPAIHPGSGTRYLSRRMTDDVFVFFSDFLIIVSKSITAGSGCIRFQKITHQHHTRIFRRKKITIPRTAGGTICFYQHICSASNS